MSATTFPDFGADTDALAVSAAFPDVIKGRTVLITGVNQKGIGYSTAVAFASQGPRTIILSGRSRAKLEECQTALRADYPSADFRLSIVDLSSQKSVRAAAAEILSWDDVPTIDIMINNAGVMLIPEHTLSADGIEMHFATNHVGHFLFTNLLMPKIIAAAKISPAGSTRIINVSSFASMVSGQRWSDPNWTKPSSSLPEDERPNFKLLKMSGLDVNEDMSYIPMGAYGASKCANALFTVSLNQRLSSTNGITSVVIHPGEVETELQRSTDKEWIEKAHKAMGIVPKTLQQGASTTMVAALDPKLGSPAEKEYGRFLMDCQVAKMPIPPHVTDGAQAERLWGVTEGLVGEKFAW